MIYECNYINCKSRVIKNSAVESQKRKINLKKSLTFFELLEKNVQSQVFEDKVKRILIEFAKRFQWSVVIGIDESQVLDEQHGHDVAPVVVVHWNPGEAWNEKNTT